MAVPLKFLLILTANTGIYSITTVPEVSVRAGDSITIPCLYHQKHINNLKYLCKGRFWMICSYLVKTDQPDVSGKFVISDDKSKHIFTVTINNVKDEDTSLYWFAVKIDAGQDIKHRFNLSVIQGIPSLYVDHQEISGFYGDSVTISCHKSSSGNMKWCRLGGSCVTASGFIDTTRVTVDQKAHKVTMSGLMPKSSGWYLCVKGDLQIPVHLNVTEKLFTTTLATRSFTELPKATEPVTLTSDAGNEAQTTDRCDQPIASVDFKSYIIPLSVIASITVALSATFMWKKPKQTEDEAAAVFTTERTNSERVVDIIYSSVVMRQQSLQRINENEDGVIYSTVA